MCNVEYLWVFFYCELCYVIILFMIICEDLLTRTSHIKKFAITEKVEIFFIPKIY